MAKMNLSRHATRQRLIQRAADKVKRLAAQGKTGTKEFSDAIRLYQRLETGMFYR